ncbi:integrase [Peptococcaceae bacterium DYL19]|nr:integrase [Phosphitispora fastidiosa]
MTTFAAGLRVGEIANLKVSDIDSKNMQILIRQGKGKKDRYSLLSPANLSILRQYWMQYRPSLWLFPGKPADKPISIRTVQQVFVDAKVRSGIQKDVSTCIYLHLRRMDVLNVKSPLDLLEGDDNE